MPNSHAWITPSPCYLRLRCGQCHGEHAGRGATGRSGRDGAPKGKGAEGQRALPCVNAYSSNIKKRSRKPFFLCNASSAPPSSLPTAYPSSPQHFLLHTPSSETLAGQFPSSGFHLSPRSRSVRHPLWDGPVPPWLWLITESRPRLPWAG